MTEEYNQAKRAEERRTQLNANYEEDLANAIWNYVLNPSNEEARVQLSYLAGERTIEEDLEDHGYGFGALVDAFEMRLEDEIAKLREELTGKIDMAQTTANEALYGHEAVKKNKKREAE